MLFDIVKHREFGDLMRKHIQELLIYLFEQQQNFGVLCKIEHLSFDPELPKHISDEFRPMTLFFLAGYTFESARIEEDRLIFEAGFGASSRSSSTRRRSSSTSPRRPNARPTNSWPATRGSKIPWRRFSPIRKTTNLLKESRGAENPGKPGLRKVRLSGSADN